jgi:hypothetical protein
MRQITRNGDVTLVDGIASDRAQAREELGVPVRLGVVLVARYSEPVRRGTPRT